MKKVDKMYEQLKNESEMRKFHNMFKHLKGVGFMLMVAISFIACEPEEDDMLMRSTSEPVVIDPVDTSDVVVNPSTISIPEGDYVYRFTDTEDPHGVRTIENHIVIAHGVYTSIAYDNGVMVDSSLVVLGQCIQIGTSDIYAFEKFYQNNHTSIYVFFQADSDFVVTSFFDMSVGDVSEILDYETFTAGKTIYTKE